MSPNISVRKTFSIDLHPGTNLHYPAIFSSTPYLVLLQETHEVLKVPPHPRHHITLTQVLRRPKVVPSPWLYKRLGIGLQLGQAVVASPSL